MAIKHHSKNRELSYCLSCARNLSLTLADSLIRYFSPYLYIYFVSVMIKQMFIKVENEE